MMLSEKPRSPVSEHRKVTKSAMEKKRRARINSSLTELKTILAGIMAYKDERFEKMEKADILELTVNYVRQLQNKSVDRDSVSQSGDDYRTGVNSCIGEVIRFVTSSDICDTETKTKLLDHLANKVNNPSPTAKTSCSDLPVNSESKNADSAESVVSSSADANNNVKQSHVSDQTSPIAVCTAQMPFNTVQSVGGYTPKMTSQVNSLQTALTVPNIVPNSVCPISQASTQFLPNVPLTILVPANFCTTAAGTTCVIPLTLSNSSSEVNVGINPNAQVGTISGDTINNSVTTGSDNEKQRIQLPDGEGINTSNLSAVGGTTVHSQQVDPAVQNLQSTEACVVLGNKSDFEQPSENVKNSTLSSGLPRSEFSVFQKYQSGKSPSHLNRESSVWRPWQPF